MRVRGPRWRRRLPRRSRLMRRGRASSRAAAPSLTCVGGGRPRPRTAPQPSGRRRARARPPPVVEAPAAASRARPAPASAAAAPRPAAPEAATPKVRAAEVELGVVRHEPHEMLAALAELLDGGTPPEGEVESLISRLQEPSDEDIDLLVAGWMDQEYLCGELAQRGAKALAEVKFFWPQFARTGGKSLPRATQAASASAPPSARAAPPPSLPSRPAERLVPRHCAPPSPLAPCSHHWLRVGGGGGRRSVTH